MFDKVLGFIRKGNSRSVKAKKNILWMLFIKGGNILIGLLLVPLTLGYVDSETYGLWMALSSMVAWIHFFDVGINNGLKNNLAQALAAGEYEKAKVYVSTTYAILCLIFVPLILTSMWKRLKRPLWCAMFAMLMEHLPFKEIMEI